MSVRPALVDCVVLSLQDSCVFYPCCKGCFSRIQVEPQDPTRCRCSRCGYICPRDNVDYRYRLSLRVTRDECIFGVTLFGSCLNPFFGIHATGLQRLVDNPDGPCEESTRSTLLVKAVRDCFIGRHVIFGIKVTETEPKPWLGRPAGSSSRDTKDTVQLISSQMIIPKALSLGGCTVVSYYQVLLQKVVDCVLGAADQSKSSGPRETSLLLLPLHSTASSIDGASLCSSGLLNHLQSLQRSQYQDCTLTPTPPWQQSLGLVTSSAEQEESCSTQDSTDGDARKRDKNKKPSGIYRDNPGYRNVEEERWLSCLPPLQCSSYNSPVFDKYSNLSVAKAVGNTFIPDTGFSPSSPGHNSSKMKCLSTSHLTNTYLSDSLSWEDLPFSESLTKFLGEENKDFIISTESEPNLQVQNQKETRSNLEVKPQSKNSSVLCVSQKYTETKDSHSQMFVGVKDTAAPNKADRRDLSGKPVGCVHSSQAETLVSQEDEDAHSGFFEDDEEQLEGNTYNCSADLFSSSPTINMNTDTLSMHTETAVTSTEAFMLLSVPKKLRTSGRNLNVSHSTPHRQKLRGNKCIYEDYLILPGTQDLDFIPPSQSTPIVKVAAGTGFASKRTIAFGKSQTHSPGSCSSDKSQPALNVNKTPTIHSSCKAKSIRANQLPLRGESTKENLWITTSSRLKLSSKRRFWKQKKQLLAQQSPRVQKKALNSGSPRRLKYTDSSSCCDVTVYDNVDNDALFVPPTPTAKSPLSVRPRTQSPTESCSGKPVCTDEQQGDGVSVISSQVRNIDGESYEKETFDGSSCYFQEGETEACDWSRDLFSDSA